MPVSRNNVDIRETLARIFQQKELAEAAVKKHSIQEEKRKAIFLIDVQGLYLGLVSWMNNNSVPLMGGELIGNLGAYLLDQAIRSVQMREAAEFSPSGISYPTFVDWVVNKDDAHIRSITKIDRWFFEVELFFAPSPLEEAKRRLKGQLRKGRTKALSDLERHLGNGHVPVYGELRDYTYYDDFVSELKRHFGAKDAEQGFFNFSIDQHGLRYFDEKEVDIRIAVRAMDIMQGEADAICIISSDQDFMPLHQRCRDGGLRTYQADAAKFDRQEYVGRKIRELGEDALLVEMPKKAVGDILARYVGSPQMIQLKDPEYEALCQLFEQVNGHPYGQWHAGRGNRKL